MEQLLDEMTWDQLQGWFDYQRIEPFGLDRIDLGFARVCASIWNTAFGKPKGVSYSPSDFMFDYEKEVERQEGRHPLTDPEEWSELKGVAMLYAEAAR